MYLPHTGHFTLPGPFGRLAVAFEVEDLVEAFVLVVVLVTITCFAIINHLPVVSLYVLSIFSCLIHVVPTTLSGVLSYCGSSRCVFLLALVPYEYAGNSYVDQYADY